MKNCEFFSSLFLPATWRNDVVVVVVVPQLALSTWGSFFYITYDTGQGHLINLWDEWG